jgi:dolichol-phosphate mannosyltransferase
MRSNLEFSVVIPARNEAFNIAKLLAEVASACGNGDNYEVIVVNDGSDDDTLEQLQRVATGATVPLRVLSNARSAGQSTSIYRAAWAAHGKWLVTLDGDGQNDPADIPAMLAKIQDVSAQAHNIKLVAGHRVTRRDNRAKRWSSKFANRLRRALLKDDAPDTGCGLKVIERALFLQLPYFDHMHRYIPALVKRHGGGMLTHSVNHRHRDAGVSNYGTLDRALVGILDLFGVWWLIRRSRLDVTPQELEIK